MLTTLIAILVGVFVLESCTSQAIKIKPPKPEAKKERELRQKKCEPKKYSPDQYNLALSGGGYRATLYHVGSLWRMHELGLLQKMDVISSVSGGSITSAWLGLQWEELKKPGNNFEKIIANPLLDFADNKIDTSAFISGTLTPGVSAGQKLAKRYDKYLYKKTTLKDLANPACEGNPRFVIQSTNLKTGKLVKFSRDEFFHYPTGNTKEAEIFVSTAVAASSAFPPVFSPLKVNFTEGLIKPVTHLNEDFSYDFCGIGRKPGSKNCISGMRDKYLLADGGVYDNLGFEEIDDDEKIKNEKKRPKKHIFVSDAGAAYKSREKVLWWLFHAIDVSSAMDSQVRALRIQQVYSTIKKHGMRGAFWRIPDPTSEIIGKISRKNRGFTTSLEMKEGLEKKLANTPTRLCNFAKEHQKLLVNLGYLHTDTAIRGFYEPNVKGKFALPKKFPYPEVMEVWKRVDFEKCPAIF